MSTSTFATRWFPKLDVGLTALAAAIWYVRPQEGLWPLGLIGLAWLLRRIVYGHFTRTTPLDVPLIIFLLSALVGAAIGYNQDIRWSQGSAPFMWAWAKFWYIVAAVAMFYSIVNLNSVSDVHQFLRLYGLVGAVVAGFFVVTNDWSAGPTKFPLLTNLGASLTAWLPRVSGQTVPANVAGGIVAFTVPSFVPLLLQSFSHRRWREVSVLAVTASVALLGLLLTATRGAWIALGLTGAIWFMAHTTNLVLASKLGVRKFQLGTNRLIWIALLATTAIVLLGLAADQFGLVALIRSAITYVNTSLPGGVNGISRLQLLRGSWPLAQDYFLTGGGLGAFPMLYSTYSLLIPVFFLPNSHNLLLDILTEQGLVGLLAYLVVLAAFLSYATYNLKYLAGSPLSAAKDSPKAQRIFECAIVSAAVAFGHSLVEDVSYGSIALLLLFVPPAMVFALQANFPRSALRLPRQWVVVAATLIALTLLWNRNVFLSAWYADLGALAQARTELSDYDWPDHLPESVRRNGDLSPSIAYFRIALELDASNRTANQRLGAIELARGQYPTALALLEAALRDEPDNESTWQLLGDAYLATGRFDDAFKFWSRVSDSDSKLDAEAWARYEVYGDHQRAEWARLLAHKIRAARSIRP